MIAYLVRRVFQGILVVFLVIIFTFFLSTLVPGGIVAALLGTHATPQRIADLKRTLGLNRPIYIQLYHYLGQILHLNFGFSYEFNEPVWSLVKGRMFHTLTLIVVGQIIVLLVAVPLGVAQGRRRNGKFDYTATFTTFFIYAMPTFLVGELLIEIFSIHIAWFPSSINATASSWALFTDPRQYVLPMIALTLPQIGAYSRYQRSGMLDTLSQDYIRTARAKGGSPRRVIYGHALKNSLLPMITLVGLTLPGLVGGALIIEDVFNIPGLGLLTVQAATNDDLPTVVALTILVAVFTVIGSMLADILYAVVDPRIRLGARAE